MRPLLFVTLLFFPVATIASAQEEGITAEKVEASMKLAD